MAEDDVVAKMYRKVLWIEIGTDEQQIKISVK